MSTVVLLSRLLHILGAVILFGGAIFIRFVLHPVAEKLPDDQHQALKASVSKRWRYIVAVAIALLIFSGFYNYIAVQAPLHRGDKAYHQIMAAKMLMAFVIFFVASVLAGRSRVFEWMRKQNKLWLSLTLALGLAVVALGSVLKVRGIVVKPSPAPAATADAPQ